MPFVLAAGAVPPFLVDVVVIVAAAALVAYVCKRIGLVPIVGFLLAGVLIGPGALGLVEDQETIEVAAEVGVLLLLFTIGIEFSLDRLAKIKRLIFVGGGIQVGLTTAIVAGLCMAFGVGWRPAVFTGFLVALSSTAIVTKLLGDRGETNSEHGQGAVGLLIFQDLAVILMVLLVPALGGGDVTGGEVAIALGTAAAIIVFVLVVARRILPPLLEHVARTCSSELFLLTVIAICFGTAYAVGLAGVSIALGAFLAGLVVSQSRFSEHALSEILPLQILFSATFFVSVGLLLDIGFLMENLMLVLGALAVVVLLKLATTFVAIRAVGRSTPVAAASALMLAQVGEFSFVLERAGREVGLAPLGMEDVGAPLFIAATVVSMALTPVAAPYAGRLASKLRDRSEAQALADAPEADPEHFADLENHTIIAGYGDGARKLSAVLDGSGVPFVIATLSPDGAREAEGHGLRVLRGDYAKQHILEAAGLQRAKLLVVPDDTPQMAHRVVSVARALSPTTRIVACVPTAHDAEEIVEAGADRAIAEQLEAVIGLFDDVLRHYRVEPDEILRHEEALRRGNYEALESEAMGTPAVECELDDDCFSTRSVTIREGTHAAGQTLAELRLDERQLHVVEIVRDGEAHAEPADDARLEVGDAVVIGGTTAAFIEAGDLFRASDAGTPEAPEVPDASPQPAG
ncbi:MAG: cation:proton antiporter [Bacteroidota bacterium]